MDLLFVIPVKFDQAKKPAQVIVVNATVLPRMRFQRRVDVGTNAGEPWYNGLPDIFGIVGASIARATTELKI